jgi:hypothetical protein
VVPVVIQEFEFNFERDITLCGGWIIDNRQKCITPELNRYHGLTE